jgi:hypothetical protein
MNTNRRDWLTGGAEDPAGRLGIGASEGSNRLGVQRYEN